MARAQGIAVTAEGGAPGAAAAGAPPFTHAQGYATGLPVAAPEAYFTEPVAAPVPLTTRLPRRRAQHHQHLQRPKDADARARQSARDRR